MYTNSQNIGSERQRDALARAEQWRRAQRLRTSSRSAGDTEQPGPHPAPDGVAAGDDYPPAPLIRSGVSASRVATTCSIPGRAVTIRTTVSSRPSASRAYAEAAPPAGPK